MRREYHKWASPQLGREMELLVFGHAGDPVVVFPTAQGRFYEFEDHGCVEALREPIEAGRLQLYCVDSVDSESWYNYRARPAQRVERHIAYENYVLVEVLPFLWARSHHQRVVVAGPSFGAFHAANFALKHPDVVSACIAMSGAFDTRQFLDGHFDQNGYFNNPIEYLPNLDDDWYLGQFRDNVRWVLAAGENDICLEETRRLSELLKSKAIGHDFHCWGQGAVHDWPLWREMTRQYIA
jgi:esterase/lipase superfamily enzyme